MRQLVQLQKSYDKIKKHDAEVVCVMREDEDEIEGLKKSRERTQSEFPLLTDLEGKATSPYSTEGFVTYVIDKQGEIQAVLPGTKTRRPTAAVVLEKLAGLPAAEPAESSD